MRHRLLLFGIKSRPGIARLLTNTRGSTFCACNSDSGGSSDEDDTGRRHKQGDQPPEENTDEPGGKKRRRTEEYRDRARERREGKGGDYDHLNVSLTQNAAELDEEGRRKQAELSRYLGG